MTIYNYDKIVVTDDLSVLYIGLTLDDTGTRILLFVYRRYRYAKV